MTALGVAMLALTTAPARPGRSGGTALAAAIGWAAWSSASLAWAQDPAWAVQAAGRAWLATGVLAALVLWPGDLPSAARARVCGALVTVVALAHAAVAWGGALSGTVLDGGRLHGALPYVNAFAILMAAGVLTALGAAAGSPGRARGAWTATATVLLGTAVAAQSRASLTALGAGLLVGAALVAPGARRAALACVLSAVGGAAVATPAVLHVRTAALAGDARGAAGTALLVLGVAAVVAGLVAARVARGTPSAADVPVRRIVPLLLALAIAIAPAAVTLGSHVDYTRIESSSSRFVAGGGSNRPDMWRVAVDLAAEHPLLGVGAGSFERPYLARRHAQVAPRFAHSVVAEPLATLGIGGAVLVVVLLGALLAGALARLPREPAAWGAAAAGAAILAQGLVDWSTEIPVVGLVLVIALVAVLPDGGTAAPRRSRRAAAATLAGVLVLATLLPLVPAVRRLDPRPAENRAVAALQAGDRPAARAAAAQALSRDPDGWLSQWIAGIVALQDGRRTRAVALLGGAAAANPHERAVRKARAALGTRAPFDARAALGWLDGA